MKRQNVTEHYAGLVPCWQLDLVVSRARRLGVHKQDMEDLMQEVVPEVREFIFEESKSNGACERTALTTLIDHRVSNFLRTEYRYASRNERFVSEAHDDRSFDPRSNMGLAIDLKALIKTLPAPEQEICKLLAKGLSNNEIARQLGLTDHQLRAAIEHIREVFAASGLTLWYGGK